MKDKFNPKAKKNDFVVIDDIDDPKSAALLKRAYNEVYLPAFPIAAERETLEQWTSRLKRGKDDIVICGENLGDPEKAVIKGICVGVYYSISDVGLLSYYAVHPKAQGQGIARQMINRVKDLMLERAEEKGGVLKGVFIEVNDPAKVPANKDSFDPALRIDVSHKLGARDIPVSYVQPPLQPGAPKCDGLKLMAYPHPKTNKYPGPDAVKAFMEAMYQSHGIDTAKDADFKKSMEDIEAWEKKPPAPARKIKPPDDKRKSGPKYG
jgi:GNAT superfamily N-acetyltransferase